MSTNPKKIKIGISSCLLGENVRYKGDNKYNELIVKLLGKQFEFVSFCPEMDIGLGVPRNPIQLTSNGQGNQIRCTAVSTQKDPSNILAGITTEFPIDEIKEKNNNTDFTRRLIDSAKRYALAHQQICGYIFKKGSPSCGVRGVKVLSKGQYHRTGMGIFAQQISKVFPGLPIEDENHLHDELSINIFIQKVEAFSHLIKRAE